MIKAQDEIYLLDIDPEKEKYMINYRKNIFKAAMGKRKRQPEIKNRINSMNSIINQTMEMNITTEYLEETMMMV